MFRGDIALGDAVAMECTTQLTQSERAIYTYGIIRFIEEDDGTHVIITHDGWGSGGESDKAFDYFKAAWLKVVLPRLKFRFEFGPINWENLPDLNAI